VTGLYLYNQKYPEITPKASSAPEIKEEIKELKF
jgi:hypothetical protein